MQGEAGVQKIQNWTYCEQTKLKHGTTKSYSKNNQRSVMQITKYVTQKHVLTKHVCSNFVSALM